MLGVATLVQVAKWILECLASETLSSHKAQKLRDPISGICQSLLAVKKEAESEGLERWVREVGKALYETSDLVDQVVADAAALAASSSLVSKVRCRSLFGLSSSSNSLFGVRMGPIINRLCQKLSELKQDATDTGLLGSESNKEHATLMTKPLPAVTTAENNMERESVGREELKEIIVERLLDTSDLNQHISVVSIVGIGGSGKTTLAQMVYIDERITNHFDLNLWVYVSDEFDIKRIIRSIILSCSAASLRINELDLDQLKDLLISKISGKIYFLVLDDVWNESREIWLDLERLLMVGARGSKILVTTRSDQVAHVSQSNFVCRVDPLIMADSWVLFQYLTFGPQEFPDNFKSIGRRILMKCQGLPLAIKAIAGVLRGRTVEEWRKIEESELWEIESYPLPSLMLSYNDLPPPLKVCFAYCSLFPKGYKINVSDLLSLWMAQGYIEPQVSLDLEDVAEQNFQELYHLSFFMDLEMDDFGNIATCRMHDLMHDLAYHVARGWGTRTHFSCSHTSDTICLFKNCLEDERKLLSFLHWIVIEDEDVPAGRIKINDIRVVEMSSFKSLRVLDLHAFDLQVLPESIGNLIHIRYLDLSYNESLQKLPNSIANLYHLQTLNLKCCYELRELPTTFGKLICLRRLEINGCDKLTCMPPGFKNLSSLRILPRYVVGRPHPQSASGFAALGNLNHLQGRLMIELSDTQVTVANEAKNSKLSNKSRLTDLGIIWGPTMHTRKTDAVLHHQLLDGLKPPTGLKLLQIEGYRGDYFPSWASGDVLSTSLPNLICVSIDGCGRCETLPPFSRLPCLKHLSLRFMDNVKFFESSTFVSPFFPSLLELTLHGFYCLEGWWKEETQVLSASFSCLQKLKLWSCPMLTSIPFFPKVEVVDMQNINEKLLEFCNASMTKTKLQTETMPSSSHLEISIFEPRGHPQNLQDLREVQIKTCPHLKNLAFVTSSENLRKLVVEGLDRLSSLTEVLKQLTSLEELEVAGCKVLDLSGRCQESCNGCEECEVPWKFLSKLHRLSLRELPKLMTLPIGLKCITSLQHLRLEGCPALKMLPEGLKDIKSLVKVDIIECPQLMERCREDGEDWQKIKHARVLCHKSWRYALMSETELSQKPKEKGKNVVVHSEDPTIHVDVTVKRL